MPVIKALLRRKLVLLGLIIILTFVVLAIFAPWVAPYAPEMQHDDGLDDIGAPLGPNDHYWLGTDTACCWWIKRPFRAIRSRPISSGHPAWRVSSNGD